MALTVNVVHSFVVGDRRETIADVTFDNSYVTGGEGLTPAQLGFFRLDALVATTARSGHTFAYDAANATLMAFAGGTQVTNATDLSTVTTRVIAHGKGQGA